MDSMFWNPSENADELRDSEARVRALRDELAGMAERIEHEAEIRLTEIHPPLRARLEALAGVDLPLEMDTVAAQLDALFRRLEALQHERPGPVPAGGYGLPADARFMRDLARYLDRLFGLDGAADAP